MPALDRAFTFSMAPLYALLNITLLLPLRLYSLATLGRNGWGTRARVEVQAPELHAAGGGYDGRSSATSLGHFSPAVALEDTAG